MSDNKPFEPLSNWEVYPPSADFLAKANMTARDSKTKQSEEDLEGFWSERAQELEWYKPWDKVLDESAKPFYKWFTEGRVNIVHNCLDRYVKTWRRNKLALIWEGEPGDQRSFSYHALNREVCKFASVIKAMGIINNAIV
jgi:acetyl-CoA synthetase